MHYEGTYFFHLTFIPQVVVGLWKNWPSVAKSGLLAISGSPWGPEGMVICGHPAVFDIHRLKNDLPDVNSGQGQH